jgi:hypothetical protein
VASAKVALVKRYIMPNYSPLICNAIDIGIDIVPRLA